MNKSQKGFTIIEVALVLAVGALIFLVVFLAVPALQRNQRNDARKRDQAQVVEAITSYIANNPTKSLGDRSGTTVYDSKNLSTTSPSGKAPDNFGKYIDKLSTNTDQVKVYKTADDFKRLSDSDKRKTIGVVEGSICKDDYKDVQSGSARQAAVLIYNETPRGFDIMCSTAN